jgi:hypothetical protein
MHVASLVFREQCTSKNLAGQVHMSIDCLPDSSMSSIGILDASTHELCEQATISNSAAAA